MKKALEYLYIFSKFSTSLILLISILVLVYFFYISFKNQEKSTNDQTEIFYEKLNQNSEEIYKVLKKVEITDSALVEIKKLLQKTPEENNLQQINELNIKIIELNSKLESISIDLKEIKTLNTAQQKNEFLASNNKNSILEKNKSQIAKLTILKFENNLDFTEELSVLQNLNDAKKNHIFEKINLINLKNYRGNLFLKKTFSKESDIFLKNKIDNNNVITNSLMELVLVEPSKKNNIKNNEINILKEIIYLLEQKNYNSSYEKISIINDYENYFSNTIKQLKIAMEFIKLIERVS